MAEFSDLSQKGKLPEVQNMDRERDKGQDRTEHIIREVEDGRIRIYNIPGKETLPIIPFNN